MVASRECLRAWCTLAMVGLLSACGGEGSKDPADDGAVPPADAANTPDASASDAAGLDGASVGMSPVLERVRVLQAGRFGHDLRIEVTGSDADADAVAIRLELTDGSGTPVVIKDSDGDGMADSLPATIALSAPIGRTAQSSTFATMALFYRDHPTVRRARVALVDDRGNVSATLDADVAVQPVLALTQQCDAKYIENRCMNGLGCKGTLPASCQMGEKPVIGKAGYYSDELGRRVLIEGTDPDDDVNGYKIEFLNATGEPVAVDLDGDLGDMEPVNSMTEMVEVTAGDGKFFFRFDPSEFFTDAVKRVRVTVMDLGMNMSAQVVKTLNDTDTMPSSMGAPLRSTGADCDARGFDRCAATAVCTMATATATKTTCVAVNTARMRACQSSLVLEPFKGMTQVRGEIKEPSLWDAPAGCATNDPKLQADNVVKLVLSRPVSRLVLSTSNPYTSFDTSLYVLTSCTAAPNIAWCADDQPGTATNASRAVLEITGPVPAADYYVVVDSFPGINVTTVNKTFQVDVQITE